MLILYEDIELTCIDDALIVLGWVLCIINSVIVHLCKKKNHSFVIMRH